MEHLSLLKKNSIIVFGKIRSKLNDQEQSNENKLDNIGNNVSKEAPFTSF